MKLACFRDVRFLEDSKGIFPATEPWPHFTVLLEKYCDSMTLVSPCRRLTPEEEASRSVREYVSLSPTLAFTRLPFYLSTEDFYRRAPFILAQAMRPISEIIASHDIVMIRYHNCLAPIIEYLAHRAGKPVVVYWTTGIITKTAFANYSGKRLKDQLARSMARIHNLYARGLARRAALNIIINQDEYGLLGKPANTHWAIPMRITDTDIKPPLRRMFQEFQVVYAGRLSQHKGVFDLLDAVALLAPEYPHLRLVLAGDGPVREGLSEKIKQYQLEDKVSLPGQMDKDNLFSLMSRSHVMALPSFNEGSPRVLWEAWAAGIPVIMTPVGAVDKHVTHNLNGLLVPPGYPQELAAAIKTLMDDETMRYQMALAGNETVVRYSWEAQIAEMAEALKRLMDDHRVTKP